MNKLINGKKISKIIFEKLKKNMESIKKKYHKVPGLGVIIVGNKRESEKYVEIKSKKRKELGILSKVIKLSENVSNSDIINIIKMYNNDVNIHGILVQLPMPKHINEEEVLSKISYKKDVDGFHAFNMGNLAMTNRNPLFIPCTPNACIKILEYENINVEGKHVVIIGKSNIVGLPVSLLLLKKDATVTVTHIKTKNIKDITKQADILISCCGQPKMINSEWIKKDVIIIDVGINYIKDDSKKSGYKLVGDVDINNVLDKIKKITPVPGGVGPLTVTMLLENTIKSFLNHYK